MEYFLKLILSIFCGYIIGWERTSKHKEAGLKTHTIVAMSSTLMMIISKYGFDGSSDGSRIAAQIVSGVGFLGAGVIFVKDENKVSGLTTAAGIWGTAGVGMAIGAGLFSLGIVSSLALIFIHQMIKVPRMIIQNDISGRDIELVLHTTLDFEISNFFDSSDFKIRRIRENKSDNTKIFNIILTYYPNQISKEQLISILSSDKRIFQYECTSWGS